MNPTHYSPVLTALVLSIAVRLDGQGTGCADTKFPAELPPPSQLVDSVHAMESLGAFADPSKPMLFSVSFPTGDSVAQVRALDKQDAAAAVSLGNYIRHARPEEFWAFRVRITGGEAAALTLERSKYCPPVSSGRDARQRQATITGTVAGVGTINPTPLPATIPGESGGPDVNAGIPIEAIISTDGQVIVARVLRSAGSAERDAAIVRDVMHEKFQPAKLDGQAIQAIYRSNGESPRP